MSSEGKERETEEDVVFPTGPGALLMRMNNASGDEGEERMGCLGKTHRKFQRDDEKLRQRDTSALLEGGDERVVSKTRETMTPDPGFHPTAAGRRSICFCKENLK